MNYTISHSDIIQADSEEDARQAYVEGWQQHFYSELDLDVKQEEEESNQ